MCAMKHYPHGSEQAGPLAMKELSEFVDCINQFAKLFLVSGLISTLGEIQVIGTISMTGVILMTGLNLSDGEDL